MKFQTELLVLLCVCWSTVKANDERNVVTGELETATVYRSGAELSHTAVALLRQGNNELIIDNIANQLDINSIRIKAPSSVTILSVEFSNNFLVSPEKTPRIHLLEDSLEKVNKEIDRLNMGLSNINDLTEVLKANRDIKGSQTGLSVTELMKLMEYYKTKSLELQNESFLLNDKVQKSKEKAGKIQNQLKEEEKKNTSSSGRLVLQLSAVMEGKYDFTVSYITSNAFWVPFYDVKVDNIKNPLQIVYKAKITQITGIDWKRIKLSLSTSMPSQWGNAPVFKAWSLSYINPVALLNGRLPGVAINNTIPSFQKDKLMKSELNEVAVTDYGTIRVRGNKTISADNQPLYVVDGRIMNDNDFAKINPSAIKTLEVLKEASATSIYGARGANGVVVVTLKDGLEDYISISDNALNVVYDIDMPYDVPSNGKLQTAVLHTFQVPANYKHYAVPKLDKEVYLLAEVPDWNKLNLLPGEANVILEGTYVGRSFIDPNSVSDTFNLTLGHDSRLVVKREKLVDFSSMKFLGSNKLQKFTYELTVKNNKKESVNLLLKDQFPLSTNKEIEVELTDSGNAEINNETGVLNWKITLAPGESKKVRFTYSVKYPKDKSLNLNS
jgi:TonB-dependent SusC/RagA subfamily outer membrane receptor